MTGELKIDRPVAGDVRSTYTEPYPQHSGAEFLAEVDSVLALPGVSGLVWEQYTPYFNDGDPCEFSVGEARVLVEGMDSEAYEEAETDYGWGYSAWDLVHWKTNEPVELPGEADALVLRDALQNLRTAGWNDVAKANFGDHAKVTATKDGFSVEFYDHD